MVLFCFSYELIFGIWRCAASSSTVCSSTVCSGTALSNEIQCIIIPPRLPRPHSWYPTLTLFPPPSRLQRRRLFHVTALLLLIPSFLPRPHSCNPGSFALFLSTFSQTCANATVDGRHTCPPYISLLSQRCVFPSPKSCNPVTFFPLVHVCSCGRSFSLSFRPFLLLLSCISVDLCFPLSVLLPFPFSRFPIPAILSSTFSPISQKCNNEFGATVDGRNVASILSVFGPEVQSLPPTPPHI